ncbi:hypothetical protein GCM10025762_60420 [Haloechinothrix salitolerans]
MVANSWATTPGRLSIIAGGLIALILLTGAVAAVTTKSKSDTTRDLVEIHEPTAADVQRLYRALSDADAAAASSLLAAGDEPVELRERYEQDIALAGPTLGLAALDRSGDERVTEQIEIVGRQVPTYAGLVEAARVNSRQQLPIGGAYLREASHLMRTEILPASERLYRIQVERVADERESAVRFPYAAAVLAVVLLVALVMAQVQIRRLSKRRLNVGLIVATAAIVLGIAWSAVAMTAHSQLVNEGHEHGSEQVNLLADTRIKALKARADELLTLVARGGGAAYEEEFAKLARGIAGDGGDGGTLREARAMIEDDEMAAHLDKSIAAAERWLTTHGEIRETDDGGDYDAAVELAIDRRRVGSAAQEFAALDTSLGNAIRSGRQLFVDETVGGARALTLLTAGWAVLALVAMAGVVGGIRQRLREYR